MAYPNSVISFTTKNSGDVIQAAHVNDLQTEVTAIETGVLTGVTTFTNRTVEPPPHMAVVFLESTMTIGSSALSTVTWTAQSILTNSSMHSTAANTARLVPQSTGVYACSAQVNFSENSTGIRNIALLDSSGGIIGQNILGAHATASVTLAGQVFGYKRFDALGGHITVELTNIGASTLSLSTGIANTWFALQKL